MMFDLKDKKFQQNFGDEIDEEQKSFNRLFTVYALTLTN